MKKLSLVPIFDRFKSKAFPIFCGASTVAMLSVPSFAADAGDLPSFTISQDMLLPVVTGIVSNIGTILPVGLALFSIMIGIRLVPGLFSSFIRMR